MTTRTIPLPTGQAHIKFRANLGGHSVRVRLNWLERYGYYTADLEIDGEPAASGRALHPDVNLLDATGVPGRLYLDGKQPRPDNLSVDNKLRYEGPE